MDDVVRFTLDVFMGLRRQGRIDGRVRERLEDVFRRYSCFGSGGGGAATSVTTGSAGGAHDGGGGGRGHVASGGRHHRGHGGGSGGHRRGHGGSRSSTSAPAPAPSAPPLLPRTPAKTLQGLLNKVTQATITSILPQVTALDMPPADKTAQILSHAEKQRGYHELFIRMVYALREPAEATTAVEDTMYDYVDTAMKQTWLLSVEEEGADDYDGFCERLKTQSYYLGRVHTALGILTMPPSRRAGPSARRGPYRSQWYDYMCRAWGPPLWPSTQALSIALYLESWGIWVRACPQFAGRYADIARDILAPNAPPLPAKLRFKAMDIIDTYGSATASVPSSRS